MLVSEASIYSAKGRAMPVGGMQKTLTIEEEYLNMLRTRSFSCFFSNMHQLADLEELLEPQQDLIPPMVHNLIHQKVHSDIKLLMESYFNTSAEELQICKKILRSIRNAKCNYQLMDSFLASFSDSTTPSSRKPFTLGSNPFCTTTQRNFRQIHDKYSSILQTIKTRHKKVARKLKLLKAIKKLSRTRLILSCGGIAAQMLSFGLFIGPAVTKLSPMVLRRKLSRFKCSKIKILVQLQEQLDTAAKGTYILGRDLETVSHLVARLSDGIERENAMARYCMERVDDKRPVQEVVKELRRSCCSSRRLVDELEEHVCLCLATINRARLLVIKVISKQHAGHRKIHS